MRDDLQFSPQRFDVATESPNLDVLALAFTCLRLYDSEVCANHSRPTKLMTLKSLSLLTSLAPTLVLSQGATSPRARITVARNVQVSKDRDTLEHGEAVLCAHPTDPNILIAGSQAGTNGKPIYSMGEKTGTTVYMSQDGGTTWHFAFDTFGLSDFSGDAACAFGPDGSVHYQAMGRVEVASNWIDTDLRLYDYRSMDGGKTWLPPVELDGSRGSDRQFMTFDNTGGKYHGRYYVTSWHAFHQRAIEGDRVQGHAGLQRSLDGGKTFDLPALKTSLGGLHNGNPVVLSNGTVIWVIGATTPSGPSPREGAPYATVDVLWSDDGGRYISGPVKVGDLREPRGPHAIGIHAISSIAVDRSVKYRDRLYVAYNTTVKGRLRAMVSYSADMGKTWSTPQSVSDDVSRNLRDSTSGPYAFAPWIAVNKDGVVGVFWLDTRDVPNDAGYHGRFAASLDGGETWSPSVRVSEQPMTPRPRWIAGSTMFLEPERKDTISLSLGANSWDFTGGDATGLDVDAPGAFHPVWVDARTGVRQIWTAHVAVDGQVVPDRNRYAGRALTAITKDVGFELDQSSYSYDEATNTLSVSAKLINRSAMAIRSPVIVRVTQLSIRSPQELNVDERVNVANSDNGQSTIGATWDFSSLIGDSLAPGARSSAKTLQFKLTGVSAPEWRARGRLNLDVVVLGDAK
jgi:hypothetical protein